MKILYITPHNPLDKSSGGGVRTAALYNCLRKIADVRTVVLPGWARPITGNEASHNIIFASDCSFYKSRLPWRIFILLACICRNPNWGFRGKPEILKTLGVDDFEYDLVVVRYVRCAIMTAAWKLGRCVIDVDDGPQDSFAAYEASKYGSLTRMVAAYLYVAWHRLICKCVDGVWVSNANDAKGLWPRQVPPQFLPNIVPMPDYHNQEGSFPKQFLLTVGCFGHLPNQRGVDRFLTEEWEAVSKRYPDLEYWVVGRSLPKELVDKWLKVHNVRLLGFVEDISVLYRDCVAVVNPQYDGAGTSIKLIESLNFGCKVFSAPAGTRGYDDRFLKAAQVTVFESGQCAQALCMWIKTPLQEKLEIRRGIRRVAEENDSAKKFELSVNRVVAAVTKMAVS